MKIEDLMETAGLARIGIDKGGLEKVFPVFEQILDYFSVMENACLDRNLFPSSFEAEVRIPSGQDPGVTLKASEHFRPDLIEDNIEASDLSGNLLNNAAERDGRFLVIPNVL